MKKSSSSFIAIIAASIFAASLMFAAESKVAGCCAKAQSEGKTCTHACCVEAAKAGDNCTKCKGSGKIQKEVKK